MSARRSRGPRLLDRPPRPLGRAAAFLAVAGTVLGLVGLAAAGPEKSEAPQASGPEYAEAALPPKPPLWSDEVVDVASRIPIQDGGRVMPLRTYASYTLYGMNHQRKVKDPWGRSLGPVPWLLDLLLRPEVARRTEVFLVEDSAVLDAIDLPPEARRTVPNPDRGGEPKEKSRRARYSYAQLDVRRARLADLAAELSKIDSKDRDPVQSAVVDLMHQVAQFEALLHAFDFARTEVAVDRSEALQALFPGRSAVTAFEASLRGPEIASLAGEAAGHHGHSGAGDAGGDPAAKSVRDRIRHLAEDAAVLAIVPPAAPREEEARWMTPGHLLEARTEAGRLPPDYESMFAALGALPGAATSGETLLPHVTTLRDGTASLARSRGEYGKIDLEVFLAKFDPFHLALYFYALAFVLVAITWLKPLRLLTWASWASVLAAVAIHATGIVIRCIVRERPPISGLYETMLFISAAGALICVVVEAITFRTIALAIGTVVGGVLLMMANGYEVMKAEDTMPQLVAVLDTNFWLAIHVTCISLGYTGGLVASLLAHVHVLGRAVGIARYNGDFYRFVSKITYGTLAFALVFSVVGTILGGIWANESWGRFWGWDPKENGALLICLAQLAIIHARLGGILKPFGIAMATIAQGMVVMFSWWHVNLLGVGLHSYGFTAGILRNLLIAYGTELAVLLTGFVVWAAGRSAPGQAVP